jgi:hypothetical protein
VKAVRQIVLVVLTYVSLVAVTPAGAAPQLSLSTTTGGAGTYVVVYGSGFWANTDGFVYFDQNYDFNLSAPGDKCGYYSDMLCEPAVAVTTDSSGGFTTAISIPPGKRVNFLGAGTYFIAANLPTGGGSDAWTPFVVPGSVVQVEPKPILDPFGRLQTGPTIAGSNFVPFRLTGLQSHGRVWFDSNGNYTFDINEPQYTVFVLTDGTLSACPDHACAIPSPAPTGKLFNPGGYLRVDIEHEADLNRSTQQRVEASVWVGCSLKIPC